MSPSLTQWRRSISANPTPRFECQTDSYAGSTFAQTRAASADTRSRTPPDASVERKDASEDWTLRSVLLGVAMDPPDDDD
jgi:hypothetical protein